MLKKPQRFVSPGRRQHRWMAAQNGKQRKALGMSPWQLRFKLDDSCALFEFFTLPVIKKVDHVGDKRVQRWGGFLHSGLQK
jgi:hypothetical protein